MRIRIGALDTLFFRDGKPFTMGAEAWGSSVFPPYPSMLYGALRSAYFSYHIDRLSEAGTDSDPTKTLQIKCLCLHRKDETYFPLPLDVVRDKKDEYNKGFIMKLEEHKAFSNCQVKTLLRPAGNNKIENISDGWLNDISLESYLRCEGDISFIKLEDIVMSEPKIGIGRSNVTHTAEDSMLYRVAMKRLLKDASLVVDFEGMDIPESGLMKFGGEGRPVYFNKLEDLLIKPPEVGSIFKLYLSTPALFKKGWLPEWMDERTLEGSFNGLRLRLVTNAIGRVIHIGGFDIKAGEPKPMRKAVPAGSVYYFETLSQETKSPVDVFHGRSVSDYYPEQGFGITYVGVVK